MHSSLLVVVLVTICTTLCTGAVTYGAVEMYPTPMGLLTKDEFITIRDDPLAHIHRYLPAFTTEYYFALGQLLFTENRFEEAKTAFINATYMCRSASCDYASFFRGLTELQLLDRAGALASISYAAKRRPSMSLYQAVLDKLNTFATEAVVTPLQLLPYPSVLNAEPIRQDQWGCASPFMTTVATLVRLQQAGVGLNAQAVNIGASNGIEEWDPVAELHTKFNFGGLAVECDPPTFAELVKNVPSSTVNKVSVCVTPRNVVQMLHDANIARDCDVFKIDIDSVDGLVVREVLLAGWRPKLVVMEVNPIIPPPFKFSVAYHPHGHAGGPFAWQRQQNAHMGCSLSWAVELMHGFGYSLLQMDWGDALFVRTDIAQQAKLQLAPDVESAYFMGFFGRADRFHCMKITTGHLFFAAMEGWQWMVPHRTYEAFDAIWKHMFTATQLQQGDGAGSMGFGPLPFMMSM